MNLHFLILVGKIFFDHQVIAAQGEQKASLALKEASDTMSESSAAMQLRYLQVKIKFQEFSTLLFVSDIKWDQC